VSGRVYLLVILSPATERCVYDTCDKASRRLIIAVMSVFFAACSYLFVDLFNDRRMSLLIATQS